LKNLQLSLFENCKWSRTSQQLDSQAFISWKSSDEPFDSFVHPPNFKPASACIHQLTFQMAKTQKDISWFATSIYIRSWPAKCCCRYLWQQKMTNLCKTRKVSHSNKKNSFLTFSAVLFDVRLRARIFFLRNLILGSEFQAVAEVKDISATNLSFFFSRETINLN
jgi:hypothetical protein